MSKTWADVVKGDSVELGGRAWLVVKIKPKGKKARVVVEAKGRTAESVVKLADRVAIVKPEAAPLHKREKIDGRPAIRQERWATADESKAANGPMPAPAEGGPWDRPADRIERKLDEILGARLVGEATDVKAGYYVPPVDVTTVAAHLALFHGGIPETATDEGRMLVAHNAQHDVAARGQAVLSVNHWHTEQRPSR